MRHEKAASGFMTVVRKDLRLAWRRRADAVAALFFFIIVASLFPLGGGTEPELLQRMAPGVIWVAALLASMLSLTRLFSDDYDDGSLEQMLLSATPLPVLVFAKAAAQWLINGLPLIVVSPLLAIQYHLNASAIVTLMVALLLGTPVLSLIGSIGSALTVGVRGAAILLALLILPLYVPVLIFGSGAVQATIDGQAIGGHVSLLGAMLALSLVLAPWAAATALRIAYD